jgi:hypothetical protein
MIRGPSGPKGPGWQGIRHAVTNEPIDLDDTFPTSHHYQMMGHPDYHKLPASIQAQVSPKDYLWLDDQGKRDLIADFTLPEVFED